MDSLIINTDNVIEIPSLANGLSGDPVNGAVVELTLLDTDGAPIAGETWPITMAYVSGSNGTYQATAGYTMTLTHKQIIRAQVVADAGAGLHREWVKPFQVIIGAE